MTTPTSVHDFTLAMADAIDKYNIGTYNEAQLATALEAAVNDWTTLGLTIPQLAASTANVVSTWNSFTAEWRIWLGGTTTGGYNSDGTISDGIAPHGGYYPLRDAIGNTFFIASPAKMVGDTQKGDRGVNASTDIAWFFPGLVGPGELMMKYQATSAGVYILADALAQIENRPTASRFIQAKKNGSNVFSITFGTGSNAGVFSNYTLNMNVNDILAFYGPNPMDMVMSDFNMTLKGS